MKNLVKISFISLGMIVLVIVVLISGFVALFWAGMNQREAESFSSFRYCLEVICIFFQSLAAHLFVPMAFLQGPFEHGLFFHLQLPIIWGMTGVCFLAVFWTTRRWKVVLWSVISCYVLVTATTNLMSYGLRIDHSKDFPIMRVIQSMDLRQHNTVEDIIQKVGEPVAKTVFTINDPFLPEGVSKTMKEFGRDQALIFVYYEKEAFDRETTMYVLFDLHDQTMFGFAGYNRPLSPDYWPNKIIDGHTSYDIVKRVVDALTLELTGGILVRLSGIEIIPEKENEAKMLLEQLALSGREVRVESDNVLIKDRVILAKVYVRKVADYLAITKGFVLVPDRKPGEYSAIGETEIFLNATFIKSGFAKSIEHNVENIP